MRDPVFSNVFLNGFLMTSRSHLRHTLNHDFQSTMHMLMLIVRILLKIDYEFEDEKVRSCWMLELELIGGDGVMDVINGIVVFVC